MESMEQGKHLILEVSHFLLRIIKPNFTFITGTVVITPANGDQIFATHTGFAMESGNNMLQVDFDHTITGGTGSVAEASGNFQIHAMVNEILSTGIATLDGNISY